MNFDWQTFCDKHHIEYVTKGPNTKKGNISIQCPFCGQSDHSQHMGLSLSSPVWGCWRDVKHRGKSPVRLIRALIHCSVEEATRISGTKIREDTESFDSLDPTKIFNHEEEKQKSHLLKIPDNFRSVSSSFSSSRRFKDYLTRTRGFEKEDLEDLVQDYDLRYCVSGVWSGRLIIPIYYEGRCATWTGRDISQDARLRYLSLSWKEADKEGNLATENIKNILFEYDSLKHRGGDILFVTEGPLDALKLDYYAKDYGCRATCLFSLTISEQQMLLLSTLKEAFNSVMIVLDSKEISASMQMEAELRFLKAKAVYLPSDIEDPGAMTGEQVYSFIKNI